MISETKRDHQEREGAGDMGKFNDPWIILSIARFQAHHKPTVNYQTHANHVETSFWGIACVRQFTDSFWWQLDQTLYCVSFRRGPNKYTRNWEDEDAYNKPAAKAIVKKTPKKLSNGNSSEEFPPLIKNSDVVADNLVVHENSQTSDDRYVTFMIQSMYWIKQLGSIRSPGQDYATLKI